MLGTSNDLLRVWVHTLRKPGFQAEFLEWEGHWCSFCHSQVKSQITERDCREIHHFHSQPICRVNGGREDLSKKRTSWKNKSFIGCWKARRHEGKEKSKNGDKKIIYISTVTESMLWRNYKGLYIPRRKTKCRQQRLLWEGPWASFLPEGLMRTHQGKRDTYGGESL